MLIEALMKPLRVNLPQDGGDVLLRPGEPVNLPAHIAGKLLRQAKGRVKLTRSRTVDWFTMWRFVAEVSSGLEPGDSRLPAVFAALQGCDAAFAQGNKAGFLVAVEEAGPQAGPAVVLLHAFPLTNVMWREQVRHLVLGFARLHLGREGQSRFLGEILGEPARPELPLPPELPEDLCPDVGTDLSPRLTKSDQPSHSPRLNKAAFAGWVRFWDEQRKKK